jgi:hypothetical protein
MWMMDHGRLVHKCIRTLADHGSCTAWDGSYGNGQANQWIESGHGKAVG